MDRRSDGQREGRDKIIVAFRNFAKGPKIATAFGIRKIQTLGKRYTRISVQNQIYMY